MCWATCLTALRQRNVYVFLWCFVNSMRWLEHGSLHSTLQEKLIDMHMHPLIAWRKIDKETGLWELRVFVVTTFFAVGGRQSWSKIDKFCRLIYSIYIHMVPLQIYFRMSLADFDRMSDDWMMMMMVMMVILDAHDYGDGNGYTCSQYRITQLHEQFANSSQISHGSTRHQMTQNDDICSLLCYHLLLHVQETCRCWCRILPTFDTVNDEHGFNSCPCQRNPCQHTGFLQSKQLHSFKSGLCSVDFQTSQPSSCIQFPHFWNCNFAGW